MATVLNTLTPVQRVLYHRPYHPWRYVPLAAYLCEQGYSDPARDRIVDFIADGGFLESLAVEGTLDPEDLEAAKEALASGRQWWASYSSRAVPPNAAIVPPELDPDPTALPNGDPTGDVDDRDAPGEPLPDYEPTEADREWFERWVEEREGLVAMREWHDRNDFHEWLEANGEPRD